MSLKYNKGSEGILDNTIQLGGDVRVMLAKATYAFTHAHRVVADIANHDNGRSVQLLGKSYVDGVFRASNTSLTAVLSTSCASLVLYQYHPVDALARLIAYINDAVDGLPLLPSAGQLVALNWDVGLNGIFRI